MQRLRDLRQYVTDLASIPRLSREETHQLTSHLAAARQGTLSPKRNGGRGVIDDCCSSIVPKSRSVCGHAAHGTTSGPAWQAAVH